MASFTPRQDSNERNLIINGNFDVWQRGTSITNRAKGDSSPTGSYTSGSPDRFKWSMAGATATARMSFSQDTDVPTYAQSGFNSKFSFLASCTTADGSVAASDLVTIRHVIEGNEYAQIHGGKNFRLQFWVKSALAGTYCVALKNGVSDRFFIKEYTIASANTWQKILLDIPTDTTGTWAFDNTSGLSIGWVLECGANFQATAGSWQTGDKWATTNQVNFLNSNANTFRLAQVMLVPQDLTTGSNASNVDISFQRAGRTIGQELTMCLRYFRSIGTTYFAGLSPPNQVFRSNVVHFSTEMRAIPTVTIFDLAGNSGKFSYAYNNSSFTDNAGFFTQNTTTTHWYHSNTGNHTAAVSVIIGLSAWTADAEL